MEITVFKERDNSTTQVNFSGTTVLELLQLLKVNAETVIVVRNGDIITEKDSLQNKDRIDVLSVISGG